MTVGNADRFGIAFGAGTGQHEQHGARVLLEGGSAMRRWNRRRASPRSASGEAEGASKPAGATARVRTKGRRRGTATVEFALAGTAFFMMIFGAVDFGRAIFVYAELHQAVRDAAREAKVRTANGNKGGAISQSLIENRVKRALNPDDSEESDRPGLAAATATYDCDPSCTSGSRLTISASVPFTTVTQDLLGISPITLTTSASVTLE
jgi:Flp pilus assembly protein TadG